MAQAHLDERIARLSDELALTCDVAGIITWLDDRARSRGALHIGRPFWAGAAHDVDKARRLVERACAHAVGPSELTLRTPTGPVTLMVRGAPHADGAVLVGRVVHREERTLTAQLSASLSEIAVLQRETARQQRTLQVSEERFRVALDGSPVLVFNQDRALRYTWVYNPHPDLGGGPILGTTDDDLVPRGEATYLRTIKQRVIETGCGAREEIMVTGGRGPLWWDLRVEPLRDRDGLIIGVTGAALDMTARKQTEAALNVLVVAGRVFGTSLDDVATLQQVAHLAVPVLADLCTIDVVSDETQELRQAAVAHTDPACDLLRTHGAQWPPYDMRATVLASRRALLDPADAPHTAGDADDVARMHGAGWIRSVMVVPLLARERILGVVSFGRIEPGRAYTSDDLHLAEELTQRAALAVDNARLYQAAQQALTAHDSLLAMVSHDLKNPLQIIISQTELLRRRIARGHTLPEQLSVHLAAVDANTQKMVRQIDGLLDLTRLQAGHRIALQRESVDLVGLVQQLLDEHQPTTDRHQLVLTTTLPELIGWWDRERLERAVANLLGNAIKYSPGGGAITVHIARSQDASGGQASVAVQDQGIGIPAAELPQLFERFRRASNVIQDFAGTGVGLASARWIVEEHGGTIGVMSEDGAGSTFTIHLPLQAARISPQIEASQRTASA